MSLGKKLKKLRKNRGLSQYEVAEKLGIQRGRLNSWENDIAKPRFEMLDDLCDFYEVNMNDLIGTENDNVIKEPKAIYEADTKNSYDHSSNLKTWLRKGNPDLTENEKDQLADDLEEYLQFRKEKILEKRKKEDD